MENAWNDNVNRLNNYNVDKMIAHKQYYDNWGVLLIYDISS